jgi:Family of unknown function (DUF6325)
MDADTRIEPQVPGDSDELGPIDVVVIAFPADAPMSGEAVPILWDLIERGIVRILDVMFVTKDEQSRISGFEARNLRGQGLEELSEFEGASSGLLGEDDIAVAGEALDPGVSAVLIMYENRWAAPFVAAVRRNGGVPVAFERVRPDDFLAALEAAEAAA